VSSRQHNDTPKEPGLARIAALMGWPLERVTALRSHLGSKAVCLLGFGSIARPLAGVLAEFGVTRFTLVDPKCYRAASIRSQCSPGEVGRLKVEVGAELLHRSGAAVCAVPFDLYTCPDGVVGAHDVVVVSADNHRAIIGANRLAARMQARLVKANIEPKYNMVSLRCFDFRLSGAPCIECQLTAASYRQQRHPRSCDAHVERSTSAPRWLSRTAGRAAALAVVQLAAPGPPSALLGQQWSWLIPGAPSVSALSPSPACRWDHSRHWQHLAPLPSQPADVRLSDLFRQAGMRPVAGTLVRFCRYVTTRVSCDRCGRAAPCIRWVTHVGQSVGRCPCGGCLLPVAYWTHRQLAASALSPVAGQSLADWGVQPLAVLEISAGKKAGAFVIGVGDRPHRFAADGFEKLRRLRGDSGGA
jgi:hypothetical protein